MLDMLLNVGQSKCSNSVKVVRELRNHNIVLATEYSVVTEAEQRFLDFKYSRLTRVKMVYQFAQPAQRFKSAVLRLSIIMLALAASLTDFAKH